jgi:hypothetical protein
MIEGDALSSRSSPAIEHAAGTDPRRLNYRFFADERAFPDAVDAPEPG